MLNEVERFLQTALAGPIISPPREGAEDLNASDGSFPCPADGSTSCKTAEWLTSRKRAGYVFGYLDSLARRNSDRENDLGCALGWAGDWASAAAAFAEAKRKAKNKEQTERANANLAIAERMLA